MSGEFWNSSLKSLINWGDFQLFMYTCIMKFIKHQNRLLWTVLTFLIASSPLSATNRIKIALGDYEPYTSSRDANAKMVEIIVREALALENIDVEYSYFPWQRAYEMTRQGETDATMPWGKTPVRLENFIFSEEIIISDPQVFYHLKNSGFDWQSFDDLKKYRIGGTMGYYISDFLRERDIEVNDVHTEDLNYRMILGDRIDAYPTSILVGRYQIDMLFGESEADRFTYHPRILNVTDYYLLISKEIPNGTEIREKFDRGLKELKRNGRYEEILRDYLPEGYSIP